MDWWQSIPCLLWVYEEESEVQDLRILDFPLYNLKQDVQHFFYYCDARVESSSFSDAAVDWNNIVHDLIMFDRANSLKINSFIIWSM